jgi:hypothetical protein
MTRLLAEVSPVFSASRGKKLMSFKQACFISYCHGQGELVKTFMDQLTRALEAYLEPYFDDCVYIDEARLQPGYRYNEALAKAICESVCMIVVLMPKYGRHSYCVREYKAMEDLERARLKFLADRSKGLIIPIILRGRLEDLPQGVRENIHFCDFSKFTTASPDISKNPEYVKKLDELARYIYDIFGEFEKTGTDPCATCSGFQLPAPNSVQLWQATPQAIFPLREAETP